MAIIKAGDGTSDPIITRMVAEDKVLVASLLEEIFTKRCQGAMVQEAKSSLYVSVVVPVLYGCGNDFGLRFAADWNTAILATIQ